MTDRDEHERRAGYRFREFGGPDRNAAPFTPAPDAARARKEDSALFRALDALAAVFERETQALRDGDFAAFKKLQGEKLSAIRLVEKSERSARTSVAPADREALEQKLSRFNSIIDANMKTLDAMRTAVGSIKNYAMKAIEDRQSDGVYAKGGALRSPARLSAIAGNQIKL